MITTTGHGAEVPLKSLDRRVLPAVPLTIVFLVAAVDAAAAQIGPPSAAASREYFETQGIRRWQANGNQGVWIQVADGRWLYAAFMTPCTDLSSSISLRFRWSLGNDLQVGASVKTASGTDCTVRRIHEVAAAGSTSPIQGALAGTEDDDLESVVVQGRESKDVPRCGVRSIVWALTRPGSVWRLVTPVEDVGPATACLSTPAAGYRWSSGMVP